MQCLARRCHATKELGIALELILKPVFLGLEADENPGRTTVTSDHDLVHAVNKILKDIIVKSKTLAGFDAPYVPGWDCHGLPIELNVEKKVGKPGVKVSPAEFRQKCRDYAARQIDGQREDFTRCSLDSTWSSTSVGSRHCKMGRSKAWARSSCRRA